jgi:hypothetical protein
LANTPSNYAVLAGRIPGSNQDDLAIAQKLYQTMATEYPGRVVMLCDRAHVLARGDWLGTMLD